ncbi:hypothetical protein WMY93_022352 [Mugilogobius chulae]|uniref:C-type lectin domain-containing protein n=1 Tax=Mugilogobius chulae TaxID=88201 RepID=A0AAW0NHC6_9GOBI
MDLNLQLLLLYGTISATLAKYVFVKSKTSWTDAQTNCQAKFTDMAPINNENDQTLIQELAAGSTAYIWFGLQRNMTDTTKWLWSGGGEVTWFNWESGQPDGTGSQNFGILVNFKWHDADDKLSGFSFCFSVHVVRQEKTWEEALKHCRKHYQDLATISSETELMLIQKELDKDVSTEHVWMGLHFLSGEWAWLDGQVREYEVWGSENKPECPTKTCGALVVNKEIKQWNAHDCQEKLHFICY